MERPLMTARVWLSEQIRRADRRIRISFVWFGNEHNGNREPPENGSRYDKTGVLGCLAFGFEIDRRRTFRHHILKLTEQLFRVVRCVLDLAWDIEEIQEQSGLNDVRQQLVFLVGLLE